MEYKLHFSSVYFFFKRRLVKKKKEGYKNMWKVMDKFCSFFNPTRENKEEHRGEMKSIGAIKF